MHASSGLITAINNIRLTTPLCRANRASAPSSSHPTLSTQATDNVPLNGPPPYPLPRQLTSSLYPPGFTTVLPSVCSPAASGAPPQSGHTTNDYNKRVKSRRAEAKNMKSMNEKKMLRSRMLASYRGIY